MSCQSCKTNIRKSAIDFTNQHIIQQQYKKNNYLSQLSNDVIGYIFEYLIHFDGHLIQYTKKSRRKPIHLDYDSEDERFGYYWDEQKKICSNCFHYGLINSLLIQKRLPFTRKDISFFVNHTQIDGKYKTTTQEKNMFHLHYFLPKLYVIDYYRQQKPQKIENKELYYIREY